MELRIIMKKFFSREITGEYKRIIKMVLKGETIQKIASAMNYSQSTVSNRLFTLFQKYNSKNRFEFINNFFLKIIDSYEAELQYYMNRNSRLVLHLKNIEEIFKNLEYSLNNKKEFSSLIQEGREYFKKLTY